ncbi:hypothetical protein PISMIDRAFT_357380 [Pisolithus microcarpus 441]|uniref:Uncharacterized protein n=1 Tax=Pisolithus microcarpus 441 TaxID=765257 RepID=A0A0C9XPP4_9AGAM|nr:hypothetical protein PISMIDRAFT_357380 [Pisolithus microcarpus 441]
MGRMLYLMVDGRHFSLPVMTGSPCSERISWCSGSRNIWACCRSIKPSVTTVARIFEIKLGMCCTIR